MIGKFFPSLLSQKDQLGESWACLLQIVPFSIYNIKKYQSYKDKCNHKTLKELCCFAKAYHDQFVRKLCSVEIKHYGNKEDSNMVSLKHLKLKYLHNTWCFPASVPHWSGKRKILDSKWPHACKKTPGHDDEVDEEDDGGDEGEDTERQDGTILHLKWVIMHNPTPRIALFVGAFVTKFAAS